MDIDLEQESLIEPMNSSVSFSSHSTTARSVSDVSSDRSGLFLPGDVVTADTGFMRGHGTYLAKDALLSSVAGVVEPINRLVSVKAPKSRYAGEIGDVVVGRILEVQVSQKRWKVDTNAKLNSILMISSMNLPGGELRRKTEEDEGQMRSYFKEGDLISAEVQTAFADGSLSLHTRSLKYGKLGQGVLVKVAPALIQRRKAHFHNLPCGAHVILGNNGYIWISKPVASGNETGGFVTDTEKVATETRKVISRLRNCILALAQNKVTLQDTSITYAYEESLGQITSHILRDDVSRLIATRTKQRLAQAKE